MNLIEPNFQLINGGYGVHPDAYERPSDYLAKDRSLHLVLDKVESTTGLESDYGVVFWAQPAPVLLLPMKTPDSILARAFFQAGLFPGPDGFDWLMTNTDRPDFFSLLPYNLGNGRSVGEPKPLFKAATVKGELPHGGGVTFVGAARGEILVGLTFAPLGSGYHRPVDSYLLHTAGGQWTPAVNVTNSPLQTGLIQASKSRSYTLANPRTRTVSLAYGPGGERFALVFYDQNVWSVAGDGAVTTTHGGSPAMIFVRCSD